MLYKFLVCATKDLIGCPERGSGGGTLMFRGSGQVGVDSIDLKVPQGRALKVPEKAGQVGLDFIRWHPVAGP